ncbi:MAG: hypothetical protein M3018_08105 [Actinomycetota bacterium]|nr:hypothetical protein [Actinomycetota bacterium]
MIPAERVATVAVRLLTLAGWLEHARDPSIGWVHTIHWLLTDGCDSPLLNDELHISELYAALYYLERARPLNTNRVHVRTSISWRSPTLHSTRIDPGMAS